MRVLEMPPVRRLFIPDDGYVLFEADLKRADPQVVAKESGEEALLQAFREGLDVYSDMGCWCYNIERLTNQQRQWHKNGINGANYACNKNTMASTIHTTLARAEEYLERWRGPTGRYPGIGRWHRRVEAQLKATMTITNVYGFKRFYTDRLDNLLPQALAWLCSSTVSVTINRGMLNVYNKLPAVKGLLQIHDSLLGEIPVDRASDLVPKIISAMEVEIPYPTPLVIPVTMKVGTQSEAWGDLPSWKEAA